MGQTSAKEIIMAPWVRDPDRGGVNIPEALKRETKDRLNAHAERHYAGLYKELVIRFRGPFCYVDASKEGDRFPMHLCRQPSFSSSTCFRATIIAR